MTDNKTRSHSSLGVDGMERASSRAMLYPVGFTDADFQKSLRSLFGILRARGVNDALVDASGNMMSSGHPPASAHWRIGLRDPRDRVPYFARVWLDDDAISTSANYEQFVAQDGRRYGHILDPRTGRPASGLLAVTVIAPDATTSDTWDTPLYVLGLEGAKQLARERADVSAILVQPGAGVDTVWVESALQPRFTLESAARALFVVRYF